MWYKSGLPSGLSNYKAGKQHGKLIMLWQNGRLQYEKNFKNGKADGLTSSWSEEGELEYELIFKDGEKIGGTERDPVRKFRKKLENYMKQKKGNK
ncbi:hypothetical protein N9M49_03355 [Flavicella sp.]|nr:hypothetical protein [Flavicella sp.]